MVEVKRIDTPAPRKTRIYWGTLLLSWIPFLGFTLSLNGLIRSIAKIATSRKSHKIDKKAVVGLLFSSVALIVSIVATNIASHPSPSITLDTAKSTISTDEDNYTLTGKITNAENGKLTINDKDVSIVDEKFSHVVALQEGDNTVTIVATNNNGSSEKTVEIHRTTKDELKARAAETARVASEPKHSFDDFYDWVNSGSGRSGCGAGGGCANWAYIDRKCSLSTRKANNDLVSYLDRACLQESYKEYMKASAFDVGTSKDGDTCDSDVAGYYHYLCSSFGDMIMAIRLADSYSHTSKDEAEKYKQEAKVIYDKIAITKGGS